jgi:hypothetical protein
MTHRKITFEVTWDDVEEFPMLPANLRDVLGDLLMDRMELETSRGFIADPTVHATIEKGGKE